MSEKEPEFVVTDRRKFRMEGGNVTANPDHVPSAEQHQAAHEAASHAAASAEQQPVSAAGPAPVAEPAQKTAEAATLQHEPAGAEELVHPIENSGEDDFEFSQAQEGDARQSGGDPAEAAGDPLAGMPPPPNAAEIEAANRAYQQTTERLDDLIRANDLGGKRETPIDFSRVAQSFYVTAMMQLGFNTPPNQQIRVDLFSARQTIDMLAIVAEKTKGNLSPAEDKLVQSMLFELRMGFLEMTQAVAQSAQAQQAGGGGRAPGAAPSAPGAGGRVTPFPGPRR